MKFISKNRKLILKFFFFILSLFLCIQCSVFSKKTIPQAPLGDRSQWILASFPESKLTLFQNLTNNKIEIRYRENGLNYVLIAKEDWDLSYKSLEWMQIAKQDLGFKYYAGDYEKQADADHFQLTDIRLGYKDNRANKHYLHSLAKSYPDLVELHSIGKSNENRPILALSLSNRKTDASEKIPVLFHCSIHANEVITTEHCYDIIYFILGSEKLIKKYLDSFQVWIIPILNPDGSEIFWQSSHLLGRKNPNVDLNRNFPFQWGKSGGKYSSKNPESPYYIGANEGSEPETKAFISLADSQKFVASVGYHAYANSLLIPYSIESVTNPDPDIALVIGEKMANGIESLHPDKEFTAKKNLYSVDGVDQDYLFFEHGTLAFIMESSHLNPDYHLTPAILKSFRSVWTNLLDQISDREKIILRITDELGYPLEADIFLDSMKFSQGEKRKSHYKTGIFFQIWNEKLTGNIRIEKKGYETVIIPIRPEQNFTPEPIRLKKSKD
ncbi:M14 family zinc carboxypeptidase [Leptospira sp. 'Mane']|uniref:M14 family zinc carboxypeptidase n=1 Tax=Leptospira sp. 'Mane' TaxID=3387407 RepID=UPI00398B6F25